MTKTNTYRVDEWNSEAVSFQLGEKWLSQNLLCSHKYELLFAALYKIIFLTKSCEYSCHQSIWQVFSHLIINHTWKQQTTALKGLPAIIYLVQSGILWWNDVAVFFINQKKWHQQKSGFTKMFLLMQIWVDICCTVYPPNDNPWV